MERGCFCLRKIILLLIATVVLSCIPVNALEISGASAIAIDALTGECFYEKNADMKRGMASTTKIMTALCALEYCDINMTVTISDTA
jgi:D-alanyl-D-alanine carboxypeptidase